jgi:hypothetical protein
MSLEGELQKRYKRLGMDRANVLAAIQASLDALYPAQTRVISLDDEVLHVVTPNASVASELRLRQIELIPRFNALSTAERRIKKLKITLRSLT